jgi:hypothetical protein
MGDENSKSAWANRHRFAIGLAVYAVAGLVVVWILTALRQYAGLPDSLDTGLIAILVAGFAAMITLVKTHIAGGGPPIFHALRVVSLVLLFTASGLLVAHWLNPANAWTTPPSVVTHDPGLATADEGFDSTIGCDRPTISD